MALCPQAQSALTENCPQGHCHPGLIAMPSSLHSYQQGIGPAQQLPLQGPAVESILPRAPTGTCSAASCPSAVSRAAQTLVLQGDCTLPGIHCCAGSSAQMYPSWASPREKPSPPTVLIPCCPSSSGGRQILPRLRKHQRSHQPASTAGVGSGSGGEEILPRGLSDAGTGPA